MIKIKRVYEEPSAQDGYRVLVDRLWPRGLSKGKAHVDRWMKEVAPSDGLRRRFGHDPEKWPSFHDGYLRELQARREELAELLRLEREHGAVTLLYGAKDRRHNNAKVLEEALEEGV